jgi:carboxylesterase type B
MMRLLFCGALLLQYAIALNTTIDLGYAKYRGKDNGNGTMRWAGMRYARSVEGMRFTAPQDPTDERDVVNATEVRPTTLLSHCTPH